MAAGLPIAVVGGFTDTPGISGRLVGPPGQVLYGAIAGGPVMVFGQQVAVQGFPITPHGNYTNPKLPGYNVTCGHSEIAWGCVPNVLVNGLPVAVADLKAGSVCACTHRIATGFPNVRVGFSGA